MKRILILFFFPALMFAQDISFDVLKAPVSPASSLLEISSNSIQKPTDVKSFMATLGNSSNNFTSFPTNFAVDFAPFLSNINKPKPYLNKDNISNNFKRSFVLSIASKGLEGSNKKDSTQQVALGFRFTLRRGAIRHKSLEELKRNLFDKNVQFPMEIDSRIPDKERLDFILKNHNDTNEINKTLRLLEFKTDSVKKVISDSLWRVSPDIVKRYFSQEAEKNKIDEFNTSLDKQQENNIINENYNALISRFGFKCDISGGLMYDFKEKVFSNGILYKGGIWITGGWEKEKYSIIGIGRLLYNPEKDFTNQFKEKIDEDVWSFDMGLRATILNSENTKKFDWNAEGLYRKFLSTNIKDTYRVVSNFSYKLYENTILTLSLGRDFDKSYFKDGNLVCFLNIVKGFGKERVN